MDKMSELELDSTISVMKDVGNVDFFKMKVRWSLEDTQCTEFLDKCEDKEFRQELFRQMTTGTYQKDMPLKSYFSNDFFELNNVRKTKVLLVFNNYPSETINNRVSGFLALYFFSKVAITKERENIITGKLLIWNSFRDVPCIYFDTLKEMTDEQAFEFCDKNIPK